MELLKLVKTLSWIVVLGGRQKTFVVKVGQTTAPTHTNTLLFRAETLHKSKSHTERGWVQRKHWTHNTLTRIFLLFFSSMSSLEISFFSWIASSSNYYCRLLGEVWFYTRAKLLFWKENIRFVSRSFGKMKSILLTDFYSKTKMKILRQKHKTSL